MSQTKPTKDKMSQKIKKTDLKRKQTTPKEQKIILTSIGNYQGCARQEEVDLIPIPITPLSTQEAQ